MSGRATPDPFLGGALMAVGAMVFALCGLCTVSFAGPALLNALRHPGSANGSGSGLLFLGLVGGVPALGGLLLLRAGWRIYRGGPSRTPDHKPEASDE
jgi:hypothetical protein